jgi:RNA polymerase sigma-70 factor (ECF subfamily)
MQQVLDVSGRPAIGGGPSSATAGAERSAARARLSADFSNSSGGGDAALVARCQRADRTAFDEIVRRYKGTVRHRLYRMTGSTEDAEDLTQEVFVRMYTSIGSFRAEASLGAWLFRIAANLCVDTFRRSKNRRRLVCSLDTAGSPPPGEGDEAVVTRDVPDWSRDPMTLLARKELSAQIGAALQALPPKQRTAVVLYHLDGLAYEQIAALEGVPLGTVKSRIFNARAALQERLGPYCESDQAGRAKLASRRRAAA